MSQFSIVILSHNRLDEIKKNLPKLFEEFDNQQCQIIVVDNFSRDGSREYLIDITQKHKELVLILNHENLGVAAGRNCGFKAANGEFIICLDDDSQFNTHQIEMVKMHFDADEQVGSIGFTVFHRITGQPQNPHGDKVIEIANYHGAGHAFRKSSLEKINYLDEDCRFGGEELDSCIRLKNEGYKCIFSPYVVVYHNSILRVSNDGLERLMNWTYNYTRILFKNFPYSQASNFSARLLLGKIFYSIQKYGISSVPKLIQADVRGKKKGLAQHKPVTLSTTKFYCDQNLKPEFGNIPILIKIVKKIRAIVKK